MQAAQITRYSLTFSRRSARAISRARFAPKSRCSTTLLSWAMRLARLERLLRGRPAPDAPAAGFGLRPEA